MIFFDVTKSSSAGHRSGLTRVNSRLREELGAALVPVAWPEWDRAVGKSDWFFTTELFSEDERPGFREFVLGRSCRCAAIFHDAIPLKHPHITWPRSVARHPGYLKILSAFDCVWANSAASREELLGFWRWQGIAAPPPVEVLPLGADFDRTPRSGTRGGQVDDKADATTRRVPLEIRGKDTASTFLTPSLICVGILEPRKNQSFLLDVCAELWAGGVAFDLHLVGRANPHFGAPIVAKIEELRRRWPGLHHHAGAGDADLAQLFSAARATVFPTIAEGSGLPLLESLWKGVPCVGSDLPALRENAAAGGCLLVAPSDAAAWKSALHRILTDDAFHTRLVAEAGLRPLPTWADAAGKLRAGLAGGFAKAV